MEIQQRSLSWRLPRTELASAACQRGGGTKPASGATLLLPSSQQQGQYPLASADS